MMVAWFVLATMLS